MSDINHPPIGPQDFIDDSLYIADSFYNACMILFKELKHTGLTNTNLLRPMGYLAAHAGELYLKAYIIAFDPKSETYKTIRKNNHDIVKLFKIAIEYDDTINVIEPSIKALNKYSGTKMRYAEGMHNNTEQSYGTDEILGIKMIKNYVLNKLSE